MRERLDTVVIGGGQAGLAMSFHLRQRGREHVILERNRIAERWRTERWDSLRFQLPNAWLALPGKTFSGSDPDGFVHHSEVLRFVLEYADEIAAPVRTGVAVTKLGFGASQGEYIVVTTQGHIQARHVVIATGPFQRPVVPACSKDVPSSILQIDAIQYRNPDDLPKGAVLVVGSGNSGCQIADELLRSGRRVFLAINRHSRVPRRYRGKDVIWWYDKLGHFDVTIDSFPARRYPPTTIMTGMYGGYDLAPASLGIAGVTLLGRVLGFSEGSLVVADDAAPLLSAADKSHAGFIALADAFADSASAQHKLRPKEECLPLPTFQPAGIGKLNLRDENIGTMIWACGYGYNYDWLNLPITDDNGVPIQTRGVTSCAGVYFLGLHWMHTFRSAILPFVGRDAAYIADHIDHAAA